MKLSVNLGSRKAPPSRNVLWIFISSELDRKTQDYIYAVGMNAGMYFDFIFAEHSQAALKTALALGYKYAVITNCTHLPNETLDPVTWSYGFQNLSSDFISSVWSAEDRGISFVNIANYLEHGPALDSQLTFQSTAFSPPLVPQSSYKNAVFTRGNERIRLKDFQHLGLKHISTLIAPASGFAVNNLIGSAETCERVDYFDVSLPALKYKKMVNEEWTPLNSSLPEPTAESQIIVDRHDLFQKEIFPNEAQVIAHWEYFRSIPKSYRELDLISNPEAVVEMMPDQNSLLWLSNIYVYSQAIQTYGADELQRSFLNLIHLLREKNPEASVCGRAPNGRYFYQRVRDFYLGLSNFNFY